MSTKSAPQKSCCSCCPPEKLLPWLLSILFTILITASAIYAYQAYFSRKPQVWVEPPLTFPPTETPSSDTDTATSAWQTYKNTQYGFEFKYPSEWSLKDGSGENTIVEVDSNYLVFKNPPASGVGDGYPINYTMWVSKTDDMYRSGSPKDVQLEKQIINGREVYLNKSAPGMYGEFAAYYKSNKGYYLEFNFSPYDDKSSQYQNQDKFFQEFIQILSTFKFLN